MQKWTDESQRKIKAACRQKAVIRTLVYEQEIYVMQVIFYILHFFITVFNLVNIIPNLALQKVCVCETTDFTTLYIFKSRNLMHSVL